MAQRTTWIAAAAAILGIPLAIGSSFAADPKGVTSGPAAGTPVVPNTVGQKDAAGKSGSGNDSAALAHASTGVGAPGVTAKSGTESGPAPKAPKPGSGKTQ